MQDVVIIGVSNRAEIWNAERWAALEAEELNPENLAAVMEELSARYPREQVESILMHEVIHWLRLMPYKLNKDRKRAAMFYAGLVMVANDVADFSEHKKETLC